MSGSGFPHDHERRVPEGGAVSHEPGITVERGHVHSAHAPSLGTLIRPASQKELLEARELAVKRTPVLGFRVQGSSHIMNQFHGFRKPTSPPNRQLIIDIYGLKPKIDDLVGEFTS